MLLTEHFCFENALGEHGPQYFVNLTASNDQLAGIPLSAANSSLTQIASRQGMADDDKDDVTVITMPPPYKDILPPAYSSMSRYQSLGLARSGGIDKAWPIWMMQLTRLLIWIDLMCCCLLIAVLVYHDFLSKHDCAFNSKIGYLVVGLYGALAVSALYALGRFNYLHPIWRLLIGAYCGMFIMRVALDGLILTFNVAPPGLTYAKTSNAPFQTNLSSWQSVVVYPVAGVCAIRDSLFSYMPPSNADSEGLDAVPLWKPDDWSILSSDENIPLSSLVSSSSPPGYVDPVFRDTDDMQPLIPELDLPRYANLLGYQFLLVHSIFVVFIVYSFFKSPYFSTMII